MEQKLQNTAEELKEAILMDTVEQSEADDAAIAAKPDYSNEIVSLVRSNVAPRVLKDRLEDYHENDIADSLKDLQPIERQKLYRVLDTAILSDVFEYIDEDEASIYLGEMGEKKASTILSNLDADTAVDILRGMDRAKRNLLIDLMDEESRRDMILVASFDDEEIGSKMTTDCVIIHDDLTIKQAMSELIRQAADNDNISTIFVIDSQDTFCGAIDLKRLIIARQGDNLKDLIVTSFPYVYGHENIDDCIEQLKDYSEDSIPVLDNNNCILGVITSQSMIQVVDDEMGEDYAKLAGLTAEEDLAEPLRESMKKRLPWLIVLLVLGMVVSGVVGAFEQVISQLTIIMAFQSLILDMAGNVGTQSLAVTIRVLMDESLTFHQKIQLVAKEMKIGLCNGTLIGIISFLFVGIYIAVFKGKGVVFGFAVSACIGLAMVLAMVISSAVGTLIPLFFKKIKIDPAVASGPLITTVNDLIAVVTYYGMSWLLLLQVLHLGN